MSSIPTATRPISLPDDTYAIRMDDATVERAVEAGLSTHDWEMFEAQTGDVAEAVAAAIRTALAAAVEAGQ